MNKNIIIGILLIIIVLLFFIFIGDSENLVGEKNNPKENFSKKNIFDNGDIPEENEEIPDDGDLYSCEVDEDCVAVKDGCCGCSSGGGSTAINKKYQDKWNSDLEIECETTLCISVISDHWTCFAEPECVDNKCELVLDG